MRKDFGVKPYTYPQPVFMLAAYDEAGKPNVMNAAWGGIKDRHQIAMCVNGAHKTVKNILATQAFTVSLANVEHMAACDYVGLVSGNNEPDKFEKAGFHATKAGHVNAPLIDELPFALECKFVSYDKESRILVGEILNVSIDEAVLNEDGKVDVEKLAPITFDPINSQYIRLGDVVGRAFHDGNALK